MLTPLSLICCNKSSVAFVTLHVGLGTFRPVSVDNIDDHEMHSEYYQINQETADLLNATKASKTYM